LITKKQK